jgi:hypothetical protein
VDNKYNSLDEVAMLFQRWAATDDGKDILHILTKRFEAPALTPPAAVDGMALALMTQQRLGEHNVVKYIKTLINREIGNDGRSTSTAD